jgi:hypothetical protein
MSDNNSGKLAAAAEALVRAAVSKMNASVIAMDREDIQGIQSITADLKGRNDDEKTLEALQASIGLMNGKVDTLNSTISQMQNTMCSIDKHGRIEFALGHCNLNKFDYNQYSDRVRQRSECLVKQMLLSFRKGSGHCMYYMTLDPYFYSNEGKLTSNKKFRDALTAQLFSLLGVEPVWDAVLQAELEEDGRRVIRYP